jgi:hypothetical protein
VRLDIRRRTVEPLLDSEFPPAPDDSRLALYPLGLMREFA